MSRPLRSLLLITDIGFILYWSLTTFVAFGVVTIPEAWLFKDYHDPNMVAWNWSFMPLDMLASLTGLFALSAASRGAAWHRLALISMTLTACAGFMAISFWSFQRSFDLNWWLPNLFLMLWPLLLLHHVPDRP
jgi:hypothetical protein